MKKYKLISVVAFLTISLFVNVSNVNSADYFPLSVGNTWIYYPSFGASGNRVDTIIGEETINGIHTYILNRQEAPDDNYNEKRWIAKDDSGVKAYKYWSNEGPDPAIIIDPPWLLFKSNPNVGDTFIGEFDPYTGIHYKTTSTIESVSETVTVPAGTFTNCVRIREKGEMTQNSVTTTVGWYKEWYAPNIGVVIYAKYSADWGSATTTQQLTGFSINGVPGDINGDGQITLTDEILALQVISLVSPSATINKQAEVNGDQKIGLEDAIYILQALAGLRTTSGKSTLNVTKVGNGQGTVTSLPAGIDCGSTCTAQYDSGTPVTLTATASSGSIFAGWSGAFTGMGTGQVTMNGNKSVAATFNNNTGPTCTYSISPTNPSFGPSGGSGALSVTAGTSCTWTATSNNSWITITSGNSGTGNGSVSYTVAVNSCPERNGTITIAGRTVAVNQANSINPTSISYNASGGSGAVSVTAGTGCTWTATSNNSWIIITSGNNGTGNGSVSYTVAVNSGPERNGTITVAGKTFTVTQSANRPLVQIIPTAITIMLPKNVPQTFTISNIGPQGTSMEYVVADDGVLGGFLDVQNATGTLAGGMSATITVSVKPEFASTGFGSLVGGTCVLNVYTPTAANYIKTPVSVYFIDTSARGTVVITRTMSERLLGRGCSPDPLVGTCTYSGLMPMTAELDLNEDPLVPGPISGTISLGANRMTCPSKTLTCPGPISLQYSPSEYTQDAYSKSISGHSDGTNITIDGVYEEYNSPTLYHLRTETFTGTVTTELLTGNLQFSGQEIRTIIYKWIGYGSCLAGVRVDETCEKTEVQTTTYSLTQ